jgi:hypothetical protein
VSDPAYAHYTVEREVSQTQADPKKAFVQAVRWGWRGSVRRISEFMLRKRRAQVLIDPQVAFHVADVVRVKDRAGAVVLSETFDNPHKGEAREHEITSALLEMDVARFREAYGIGPEHGEP